MSRQVNKVVKAPKFRIESTIEALQVAKQGDWGFAFDLKSAYHQVPLHPDFYKYFGFKIEKEEGKVEESSSRQRRGLGSRKDSVHPTFLMVNKCDHNELRRKFRNYEI